MTEPTSYTDRPIKTSAWMSSGETESPLPVGEARRAADEAQAVYHELQRQNDAMIMRRREAIDRGDLPQAKRLAPEHRALIRELRNAADQWNLAVARLLDAQLHEQGY